MLSMEQILHLPSISDCRKCLSMQQALVLLDWVKVMSQIYILYSLLHNNHLLYKFFTTFMGVPHALESQGLMKSILISWFITWNIDIIVGERLDINKIINDHFITIINFTTRRNIIRNSLTYHIYY
jgi:hypothetical protein